MAGTKIGGQKARDKNLASDPDFYKRIGQKGGSAISKYPKGFAADPELARTAGAKGGRISRRRPIVTEQAKQISEDKGIK